MLFRYILSVSLLFLIACKAETGDMSHNNEQKDKTDKISEPYKMLVTQQDFKDETTDIGMWFHHIEYPEILSGGSDVGRKQANALINKLADQHNCDGPGDKSFLAKVNYVNNNIISFSYEEMLMCEGMAGPSSSVNAMTVNLHTGQTVDLSAEFKNSQHYSDVQNKVIAALNAELKKKDATLGCEQTVSDWYYYVAEDSILFNYDSPHHGMVDCHVEFVMNLRELKAYLKADSPFIQ